MSGFKNEDLLWKDLTCKFDAQDFKRNIFRFIISVDSAIKFLNVENFITRSFDVRVNGIDINFNWNISNNPCPENLYAGMKAQSDVLC